MTLLLAGRQSGVSRLIVLATVIVQGCTADSAFQPHVEGGDARRGRLLMEQLECGACHLIPGVRGARGWVGPALEGYRHRIYVAGKFPNTPQTLVQWLRNPPALAPMTAMPSLGLDEQQARDMAAYLYTLE